MENNAITPQLVNEITAIPIEEITKLSEEVMESTKITSRASEELVHLSKCLADFSETHEMYQKRAKHVRDQMRYLSSHI